MAKSFGHLVLLNSEYLYSAAHGEMYAPLRVNERVIQKIQEKIRTQKPDDKSCIKTIDGVWSNGKFMLATEFTPSAKCSSCFTGASRQAKTELCFRQLCNGKCTDKFMRDVVAINILPELYNTKQR